MRFDLHGAENSDDGQDHCQNVNGSGTPKKRVNNSAQSRSQDGRALESGGSPGHGIREMFFRNQLREQRAADWSGEGTDHAKKNENRENVINRAHTPPC